jgi:hypothetical protein
MWFLKPSGNWVLSDLEDLTDELQNWWDEQIAPNVSVNLELNEVRAYAMHSNLAPVHTASATFTGDRAGTPLPGQDVMTVTFITANRGRSGRGRNYISGFLPTDVTNNRWGSTQRTGIATGYQNLASYVNPLTLGSHVVVSFQHDGVTLSEGLPQPVVAYRANEPVYNMQNRSRP